MLFTMYINISIVFKTCIILQHLCLTKAINSNLGRSSIFWLLDIIGVVTIQRAGSSLTNVQRFDYCVNCCFWISVLMSLTYQSYVPTRTSVFNLFCRTIFLSLLASSFNFCQKFIFSILLYYISNYAYCVFVKLGSMVFGNNKNLQLTNMTLCDNSDFNYWCHVFTTKYLNFVVDCT